MLRPDYIPFNLPSMVGRELDYIVEAVRGGHLAGDGVFTRRCQQWLEQHCGAHKVLLTHSCTAALEMAAPEGSVTCPRKMPVTAGDAAACDKANVVAQDCKYKIMSAKKRYFQTFIPLFHSTT